MVEGSDTPRGFPVRPLDLDFGGVWRSVFVGKAAILKYADGDLGQPTGRQVSNEAGARSPCGGVKDASPCVGPGPAQAMKLLRITKVEIVF